MFFRPENIKVLTFLLLTQKQDKILIKDDFYILVGELELLL